MSLENHPLIVPKKHIVDIYSLDDELGAEIMREAIKIAKAVKRGLKCDGVYVTQANESAAGQDVFHYHMHIYPRWNDSRQWESDEENRKLTAENIKSVYRRFAAKIWKNSHKSLLCKGSYKIRKKYE